ncbi:MAG: exodeoxyribonuclease III [marine bacterium B5-7]|nr:MAG: exodeoxyribonuclease III [marine bacterium B5-7]
MKFITWNVNGIRAVERKGELQKLVDAQSPDFLLIQEIKGNADQFSAYLKDNPDYRQFYHSAEKKGYAGTGLWMSRAMDEQIENVEFRTDVPKMPNADEGRVAWLSFDIGGKGHDLMSIYFPNGGKSEEAWRDKLRFYDSIHSLMNSIRNAGRTVIVGGDMNVAHTEIDIARPKENDGKIGFHPDERAWMDRMINDHWFDLWRAQHPDEVDVYSYWDMVSRARDRNVGWRIDYFLSSGDVLERIEEIDYLHEQMGSDHCPLRMNLGL